MPEDSTPATKISSLRSALGMSQQEFAKELEVAQAAVSSWERGEYAPSGESYELLAKLAAKHSLHPETLWFLEQTSIGGTGAAAAAEAMVKEGRSKQQAIYRQALAEAKTSYPNDDIAQHRYAQAALRRALRKK